MYVMKDYDSALEKILKEGVLKENRTGVDTISVFGIQSRYKIDQHFPFLTGRKLRFKSMIGELLWFLSGSTNNEDLKNLGCKFWTPWVDEEFEKEHGFAPGSFGPVYGFQLRYFGGEYGDGVKGRMEPNTIASGEHLIPYGSGGFDQLAYMMDRLKNHPNCRRNLFSLWNPKQMHQMRLPPCFTKGNKVLTSNGYFSIEDINVGDYVYSNDGDFRKVNRVFKTLHDGDIFRFDMFYNSENSPTSIICTGNHPILVKNKGFIKASKVREGDFFGIKINKKKKNPIFKGVSYVNQYSERTDYTPNEDDWYMMGYFLGDGWCGQKDNKVSFAIADKQKDEILPLLRKSIKISLKKGDSQSAATYETRSVKWNQVLKQFGHKAHNKNIPQWVIDAPKKYLKKFIEGYFDADGCSVKNMKVFTTTSLGISLGMRQVFAKLGKLVKLYTSRRKDTTIIEGRVVNQQPYLYSIVYSEKINKDGEGQKYIFDDDYLWIKVNHCHKRKTKEFVYNLDVDVDHTYTVNNFVNHNCHYTFQLYVENGKLSGELTQRSCDFPVGVPFNIAFYSAFIYMLAQQVGLEPNEFVHSTVDSHIYVNQIEQVEEYLSRSKPDSPKLELNRAKDIDLYSPDDFVLKDYFPNSTMSFEVAV